MPLSATELEPFRRAAAVLGGDRSTRESPADWLTRRTGERTYARQREVMESVWRNRRTAVPSSFDTGKSFSASRLACWWIDTHPPGDAIVVSTATSFPQVRGIVWQEIKRAHAAAGLLGTVNQTEWWIDGRLVGFGRRPPDWSPDAFTGIHRPYVLVVIDEASGVPRSIYEAAEGLITNEDSRILAIGNPWAGDSYFAEICGPTSNWNVIQISAFDTPAYTGEEMSDIAMRSLVSTTWVEEMRSSYGEDSAVWQTKVLGRFPDESDDQLLPLAWVQRAIDHDDSVAKTLINHPVIAVDVARYGEDETVVGARWGHHFEVVATWRKKPVTYTAGAVKRLAIELRSRDVRVDDDGVGGGVTDILREEGISVQALRGGLTPRDPSAYVNARSEWYWQARLRLQAGEADLPDDRDLLAQLTSIHYSLDRKGRIAVESKDDMRKRGVKSPDRADCWIYAYATGAGHAPVAIPSGLSIPSPNLVPA